MTDAWSVVGDIVKVAGGALAGWFLHAVKERYERRELRHALYRELADNYSGIRYNCVEERFDFDWLRKNLRDQLSFHAYKKASGNPEAFYCITEHGWFERCFKELEKCAALSDDDKELMEQLQRGAATIEGIAPPADTDLFRSMLPRQYAANIK
jgi:hypothetical protein